MRAQSCEADTGGSLARRARARDTRAALWWRAAALTVLGLGLGSCKNAGATADAGPEPAPAASAPTAVAVTAAALHSGVAAPGAPSGALDFCRMCAPPVARATVTSREIKEGSGLVASAVHPDVFYAHNDSGDTARFFAVSAAGGDLGTFTLDDAQAQDWEDMGRGPCEGGHGSCLYLADIGDNAEKRGEYVVYRVVEPQQLGPGDKHLRADRIEFSYPDGNHNAETLLVHPETGVLTIVTKVAFGASAVFEFPASLPTGQRVTLRQTGSISPAEGSPRYTGGDVHPRGAGVLLRTYTNLFFYPMRPGQSVADALAGSACAVPDADEEQGESVAWLRSGAGYVTLSEGVAQKLNVVDCGGR